MARTAEMKLLELMVLKDDISAVIEYREFSVSDKA